MGSIDLLDLDIGYQPLLDARTALLEAQTKGAELDNDLARSLAETARIALSKEVRRDQWEKAGENFHRIGHLTEEISHENVSAWIDVLSRWDRIDAEEEQQSGIVAQPYRLILCSPGGDIIPGMKFYSFLKGLTERRPIWIVASGLCASMATVIHQAGTRRLIEKGCSYLIHEATAVMGGRTDKIMDTAGWLTGLNDKVREFLAEKSKLTADEIKVKSDRREWWLSAEEAVEYGFADEIGFLQ